MSEEKTQQIVADYLREGETLSKIQALLKSDHDIHMTFMDLRLMAADIEVDWSKFDPQQEAVEEESTDSTAEVMPEGIQVEISKIARPGAMVHGTVSFTNGNKGEWLVDEYGQLGFQLDDESNPPEANEMQEFEMELRRLLQG